MRASSPRAIRSPSASRWRIPALAKGLVKRDVIRIVTPGTVTESSMLDRGAEQLLMPASSPRTACAASAFCDVSTGALPRHADERRRLGRIRLQRDSGAFCPPRLCSGGERRGKRTRAMRCSASGSAACVDRGHAMRSLTLRAARLRCDAQFGDAGIAGADALRASAAAGALLETLEKFAEERPAAHPAARISTCAGRFMGLDLAARRNLELTQTHALEGEAREPALGARPDARRPWAAVCCAAGWSVPCSPPRRSPSGFPPWRS